MQPCADAGVLIGVVAAARANDAAAAIIVLRMEQLLESNVPSPKRARTKRPGAAEFYSQGVCSTARHCNPAPQHQRADKNKIEEIDREPGREGGRVKAEMIVKKSGEPAAPGHAPAAAQ